MSQNKNRYAVHCTDENGNYAIDDQQEQVTLFATTAVDRLNALTAERDRLKANDREGANTIMDLMKQLETARFELEVLKVERDELLAIIENWKKTYEDMRSVAESMQGERDALLAQKPAWSYEGYKNDLNSCRVQLGHEQAEVKRLTAENEKLMRTVKYGCGNSTDQERMDLVREERDEAVALLRDFYRMARAEHEADLWVRVQRFFREHPPQDVVVNEKGIQR